MNTATLFLGGVFALVGSIIFFYVGARLKARPIDAADSRLAWRLFVVWWFGVATSTLLTSAQTIMAGLGVQNLAIYLTISHLNVLSICVALFGLLYYLAFLLAGNSRPMVPLMVFYVAYYALLEYYLSAQFPTGLAVGRWTVTLKYPHDMGGPLFAVVLGLLVLPQMIGSLVYFLLFFRVRDVTQRYRILLVSWSIFLWFGSALVGSAAGYQASDWWQVFTRVIGLAAALVIFLAYQPFQWIRRRFGVTSMSGGTPAEG